MPGISSNTKKLLIRILLFLVYLLLGAGMFYGVEYSKEVELRGKNHFMDEYNNFSKRYNISEDVLTEFINNLTEAVKLGFSTKTGKWKNYRWEFMNAFHFAGNVVTTIGYGHIAPTTVLGRILCIFYALVGIPLTGLTLRSIGNRISEFIATTIKIVDRRVYNRETEKLEIKTAIVAFVSLLIIILIPAVGFSNIETWDYADSVYFCFITLTTIGFGDFVPGEDRVNYPDGLEALLEFLNLFYMVLGLAVMSGVIVSISGVIEEKTKNLGVVDPLEALRNIRVENLNSRALKKLGYKMGPGTGPQGAGAPLNHNEPRRLPPKLAPKAMAVAAVSATMERSRSAETMEFQGPTPVMYLQKRTVASHTNEAYNTASPAGSKIFNNKIAPVDLGENCLDRTSPTKGLEDSRKRSEHNSTSTESAEEARASDEDSEGTKNESTAVREEAQLDGEPSVSQDLKNNLVVQVQLTPMPSPRASPVPVPARSSLDSIPATGAKGDPEAEPIETYEESIRGSIDSSQAFQMNATTSSDDSKMTDRTASIDGSKTSDRTISLDDSTGNSRDDHNGFTNSKNPRTKGKTNELHKAGTKNGFISKNHPKPNPKRGRTLKSVEHIDLGDKTVSKAPR